MCTKKYRSAKFQSETLNNARLMNVSVRYNYLWLDYNSISIVYVSTFAFYRIIIVLNLLQSNRFSGGAFKSQTIFEFVFIFGSSDIFGSPAVKVGFH